MNRQALLRLIVFYIIAITVSNVFRFDLLHINDFLSSLPVWTMIFYSPLQALGVILGALLAVKLLRKNTNTEITLWGTSKRWSLFMCVFPVALLTILGVNNNMSSNAHYYGFMAGFSTLIYCVFEEYGWRGYLEQELKPVPEYIRILIIGVLWYVWHLTFLNTTDLTYNLIFLGALIFGSWGIGKVVKITKSVVAASCIHMTINILLFNGGIRNGLDRTDKIIVLAVLIPIWVIILRKWKKDNSVVPQLMETKAVSL